MSQQFDRVFSALVMVGVLGFLVFNSANVTALAQGLTGSAVSFVSGVRGKAAA